MLLMLVPLIVLYYLSVLLAYAFGPKPEASDQPASAA
jgi:Sec-independent protein secretion pathway component TatC